jgi:hypothetical protein
MNYRWLITGLDSTTSFSRQSSFISIKDSTTAFLNFSVDVLAFENLDSIPSLIIFGAARSTRHKMVNQMLVAMSRGKRVTYS